MSKVTIINTHWRGHEGLWSFSLAGGRIETISPQHATRPAASVEGEVVDAGGGFVTPALVDSHVHLDRAFTLAAPGSEDVVTLSRAITAWRAIKTGLDAQTVRQNALRAIDAEIDCGVGIFRCHTDVSSAAGLRLCEGLLSAREQTANICKIQIVAYPQDGLVCDPAAADNIREAFRLGADLVGGIPQVERHPRDGLRHLEMVFDLAAAADANIDVHLDETDDPGCRYTEMLAALTVERGWQGRVTASQVCALASYPDAYAARVIDLLAEARVSVALTPAVNLHTQARQDRYPKRRGVTRVRALLDAGINVATGQEGIRDPFYPLGGGGLLEQVFLLVHAEQMTTLEQMRQTMETVCCQAGEVLNLGHHRPELGAPANLAVWPVEHVGELIRLRPRPLAVLHAGRVVAGSACGPRRAG